MNSGYLIMKKISWLKVSEEPIAGYNLKNIFVLLWQNKFRIHPKYFLRFSFGIGLATILTPLRIIEKMLIRRKVKKTSLTKDPVFIIGHYRTGTTYLITLLSKDKSKGYVSNLEGYAPHMFVTFKKPISKILGWLLPDTRPMDDVEMSVEEPTEDEYSVGAFSKYGFYNGFIFPRNFQLYSDYNSFDNYPKDAQKWKKIYHYIVQKLTYSYNGNQLFLKNPACCYRVPYLLEMYPNAKFIYTYRNPYNMYASNYKFYYEVFEIYRLQNYNDETMQAIMTENYVEMVEKYNEAKKLIRPENFIDIRYEDFIKDPMHHIKKIYTQFGLNNFEETLPAFQAHVDDQKSYTPNIHKISDDIINRVNKNWDHIREQFGYEKQHPTDAKKVEMTLNVSQ
jgi:hypothetical protein